MLVVNPEDVPFPLDLPLYFDKEVCESHDNVTTLSECEMAGAKFAFGLIFILLALAIVVGNTLLPLAVWKNRQMRTKYNFIKVSLAVADMIAGLALFFQIPINMAWVSGATLYEFHIAGVVRANSVGATLSGLCVILSIESSLLHLMFLSIERFLVIQWPLWHRRRSSSFVRWALVGVWILSLLKSLLPVMLPSNFIYTLVPPILINMLAIDLANFTEFFWMMLFLLPYSTTIIFMVAAGIAACLKSRTNRREIEGISGGDSRQGSIHVGSGGNARVPVVQQANSSNARFLKREVQVLKTILLMITCFTITIAPSVFMFARNIISGQRQNVRVLVTVCCFVMFSNSLFNVLIYTARDQMFRKTVKSLIMSSMSNCWRRTSV